MPDMQGNGADVGKTVQFVMQGLTVLSQIQGLPPEFTKAMGQLQQMFAQAVDMLGGGGGQGAAPSQAGQEAGGNPNARPAM